jgi:hypothetical protein
MQPYQIKEKVASAINDQDLRKSIRVMNDIHEAHEPMHDLPRGAQTPDGLAPGPRVPIDRSNSRRYRSLAFAIFQRP